MLQTPRPRRPGSRRLRPLVATLVVLLSACGGAVHAASPAPRPYPQTPGPTRAVGHDSIRILPRGTTAFPVIASLIAGARSSVELEMYEFGSIPLTTALIDARRRGVQVTVIDDPSVDVTRATAARLRDAGVDVLDYPVRKGMIDHVKLLVVDRTVAVVGGINWGATSDANHDVDAEITGPAAANLDHVYGDDLLTCGRTPASPGTVVDDRAVLVAATLPGTDIRPLALQLVESARSTLDFELYVLTDRGIVEAIEDAARRGVRVRVLLDPDQRPSDASAAALAAAGIEVRLYRGGGEKLHAKLAVADGRASLFGSANWTAGGFERNHELDVEVPDSAGIAGDLTRMVDADWAASAP